VFVFIRFFKEKIKIFSKILAGFVRTVWLLFYAKKYCNFLLTYLFSFLYNSFVGKFLRRLYE